MPNESNDSSDKGKLSEEFDQDKASSSGEKGMRPVSNLTMINFLHWVKRHHPEVRSLQYLSEHQLFQLVSIFEGCDIQWDQWYASFNLLLEGHSNKEGYEGARRILRQLDL